MRKVARTDRVDFRQLRVAKDPYRVGFLVVPNRGRVGADHGYLLGYASGGASAPSAVP